MYISLENSFLYTYDEENVKGPVTYNDLLKLDQNNLKVKQTNSEEEFISFKEVRFQVNRSKEHKYAFLNNIMDHVNVDGWNNTNKKVISKTKTESKIPSKIRNFFSPSIPLSICYFISIAVVFTVAHIIINIPFLSSVALYIPLLVLSVIPTLLLYFGIEQLKKTNTVTGFVFLAAFATILHSLVTLLVLTVTYPNKGLPWLAESESAIIVSHEINKTLNPTFLNSLPYYVDIEVIKQQVNNLPTDRKSETYKRFLSDTDFSNITVKNIDLYLNKVAEGIKLHNQERINNYVQVVTKYEQGNEDYYRFLPAPFLLKLYLPALKQTIILFNL